MDNLIQKERTHLFSPSINVVVLATIKGSECSAKISDEVLHRAISEAVSSHEILCSKITLDKNGMAFYEKTDKPFFLIKHFYCDWKNVVKEQETIPFDLEQGELIRFFVNINTDYTSLLIIAHHLAGDGLSIAYFADDIMKSLNNVPLSYQSITLFNGDSAPKNSRLNPFMRFMLDRSNKKWNKTGKQFSFAEYRDMFARYWQSRETEIFYEEFGESLLTALKKSAKQHAVTMNTVLTTAFAKAANEPSDIGFAANIREAGYRGMGNWATGLSVQYTYDSKMDFWTNAQAVHRLIYNKLSNNKKKFFLLQFMGGISSTLIDAAYFSAFAGYENEVAKRVCNMFGYNGKPKSISISNLAALDIPAQHGAYYLDNLVFIPPLVPNAKRVFGILTFKNKMTITFHVGNNDLLQYEKNFFDNAMSILRQL